MRAIKFLQRCDFDYGDGPVAHEPGDIVGIHDGGDAVALDGQGHATLRTDKAQRWVTRSAAVFVDVKAPEAPETAKVVDPAAAADASTSSADDTKGDGAQKGDSDAGQAADKAGSKPGAKKAAK